MFNNQLSKEKERRKKKMKPWFVAFAIICGVNISIMANLSVGKRHTQ